MAKGEQVLETRQALVLEEGEQVLVARQVLVLEEEPVLLVGGEEVGQGTGMGSSRHHFGRLTGLTGRIPCLLQLAVRGLLIH